MPNFVTPKVHHVGCTTIDREGLERYLNESGQGDFVATMKAARECGLSDGEILCSFSGKLCYKTLVLGKNDNVSRIRDIPDNLKKGILGTAHLSVLEHLQVNFLATNVSRVFSHELVRHRVGAAYSQTSGRYCRLDTIDFVMDPILEPVKDLVGKAVKYDEDVVYLMECRLGMRKAPPRPEGVDIDYAPEYYLNTGHGKWVPDESFDFEKRKKLTSAIRRIAPNGQGNEIAFSYNARTLRHTIQARTSRHAEWEIRVVFDQVFRIMKEKYPLLVSDAREEVVEGLVEVTGMKQQPYDAKPLCDYTDAELNKEFDRRRAEASRYQSAS